MDHIEKYTFEIFSKLKMYEIEFKIFKLNEKFKTLKIQYRDSPSSDQKTTLILVESQINGEKNSLYELKLQLENFKKEIDEQL